MIAEPSAGSVKVWAPPAALAAVSTLLMLGGPQLSQILRYDRAAVAAGQWWRLFSGNLVHLGWWHLLFNVLSLVLLVLLCPERLSWAEWLRRIVLIGTGMSLCLYFLVPGLPDYVGLSGLVYGLFALGLGRQALRRDEIGIACLVFLAARIGWELVEGAPASETELLGGGVVAESHLYGVLCALVYAAAAYAVSRTYGKFFKQSRDR
jgi:rhomboid family GlyGly-CTERM serine protease